MYDGIYVLANTGFSQLGHQPVNLDCRLKWDLIMSISSLQYEVVAGCGPSAVRSLSLDVVSECSFTMLQ